MTSSNPLERLKREQIELFVAQGLSEATSQTAAAHLKDMEITSSDTATLTIQVRFLPENPEEGTEH